MIDVIRSQPAPESLTQRKRYDGDDVKERLLADFLGKCYLTEKIVGRASFQIEHRRPIREFPESKFEWNNLFPADADANNRRDRKWPDGGLLDPAGGDGVERRVRQWLDDESHPHFAAMKSSDRAAANTAAELDHLHNDGLKAADLRSAITNQLCRVLERVLEYERTRNKVPADPVRLIELETEIKRLLSRRSPYTMLVRSRLPAYQAWFD